MNIGAVNTSYYDNANSNNSNNSSKITSLEKQRESLSSERESIQSSDSKNKDTEIAVIDAQIQVIDAQIQQLQNEQVKNYDVKGKAVEQPSEYNSSNGDELKNGVILSGSLKELIENYSYKEE